MFFVIRLPFIICDKGRASVVIGGLKGPKGTSH